MSWKRDVSALVAAVAAIVGIVLVYAEWLQVTNAVIVALTFLLVILLVAASARFWVAATSSVVAMFAFNFFFLPPVGTFYLENPQNWVALFVFLAVGLVASNLSTAARARAREAIDRQNELGRLFDLSRDVLMTTDSQAAITELARFIALRFALDFVAIGLPRAEGWDIYEQGAAAVGLDTARLLETLPRLNGDDEGRSHRSAHQTIEVGGRALRLVPLRMGAKAVGLLVTSGRSIESATLDALAGVVAIAIERAEFLEARKAAEVARRSEELKSALLASIGHDLRTPLTAIRVAASNLQASWLDDEERREQSELILAEAERLRRLFQNILEMARIDAGAIAAELRWVHPSEIVEAARDKVGLSLRRHPVELQVESDVVIQLDPRLTASALAYVLENAAQYSPPESPIVVGVRVTSEGLEITVRDRGPGILPADLPHLFERFYRGTESKRRPAGTGIGLSIARGMLAAERGRIWAENCAGGGAQFTIVVAAERRMTSYGEEDSEERPGSEADLPTPDPSPPPARIAADFIAREGGHSPDRTAVECQS